MGRSVQRVKTLVAGLNTLEARHLDPASDGADQEQVDGEGEADQGSAAEDSGFLVDVSQEHAADDEEGHAAEEVGGACGGFVVVLVVHVPSMGRATPDRSERRPISAS